ncbi:MAG: hypothetical protein QG612_416 [Pseudomonadota bacterium]|nr:hypothetical protein [Pseudomonadota bacterium]
MTLTAVPDPSSDAWLLALGTVAALALAGRLWHCWQQSRSRGPALTSLSFDSVSSFEPVSAGLPDETQMLVDEVQDRLGVQLLTARTLARSGDGLPGSGRLLQLDRQLAQALLSLRLMREAVRPEPATLGEGLHGLQAHFQPMLAERGIRLHWRVGEEAARMTLSARSRLNLMRLAQEGLDNVVRHAQGAQQARLDLTVETGASLQERSLRLLISDDGHGKPEGRRAESTARGIEAMERLARELGARLAVGPSRPGWRVELTLNAG